MSSMLAMILVLSGLQTGAHPAAEGSAVPLSIPLEVRTMVSGGYWETPAEHGVYRVIIVESGWEWVTCTASLEWIAERDETGSRQVVSSLEITEIPAGTWSLGVPEFVFGEQGFGTVLSITTVDPAGGGGSTFLFELGSPGSYMEIP